VAQACVSPWPATIWQEPWGYCSQYRPCCLHWAHDGPPGLPFCRPGCAAPRSGQRASGRQEKRASSDAARTFL